MSCRNIRSELFELKAAVAEIAARLDVALEALPPEAGDQFEFGWASGSDSCTVQGLSNEGNSAADDCCLDDETQVTDFLAPTSALAQSNLTLDAPSDGASLVPPPLPDDFVGDEQTVDADNLCLIKGVDTACAGVLAICDVQTFAAIARFQAEDVYKFNTLLGASDRVQRENWIEQAAILAKGRMTKFAATCADDPDRARVVSEDADSRDVVRNIDAFAEATHESDSVAEVIAFPVKRALKSAFAAPTMPCEAVTNDNVAGDDNLRWIKGIDADCVAVVAKHGVRSYAAVARFQAEDVHNFNTLLGVSDRVQRENWIEQAAILACGRLTKFAATCADHQDQPIDTAEASNDVDRAPDTVSTDGPGQGQPPTPKVASVSVQQQSGADNLPVTSNRWSVWRSIAACLLVGILALPLIGGDPGNGQHDTNPSRGNAWCRDTQSQTIDTCLVPSLRLARAFR